MSVVQNLSAEATTFQTPYMVSAKDLHDASVEITSHPWLPEGTTTLTMQPPQCFSAVLEDGGLRIRSADGAHGGRIQLQVGLGGSPGGEWHVSTTEGNVSARGTHELPLALGNLSLQTTGHGRVDASYVRATGNVFLVHPDRRRIGYTRTVIAPEIIVQSDEGRFGKSRPSQRGSL